MPCSLFLTILLHAALLHATAQDQPPAAQPPAPQPAAEPAKTVAVTVNGHALMESQIDEAFEDFYMQRSRGRAMPAGVKEQMRQQMRTTILDELINDTLFDEQASLAQIQVTDEQLLEEMKTALRGYLVRTGSTEEDFRQQLAGTNTTLEQFLKDRSQDPNFRKSVVQDKLLEKRYANDLVVSAAEVEARYQRDLSEVFTKPEQVKASHILLGVKPDSTAEDKAAAQAKAQQILAEARGPAADFGALAGTHSSCPSSAQGGDLGFFPREGAMVEPFAAAAFALQPGEISEVVETQFGYHIIKVTERRESSVMSLAQATGVITNDLREEKLAKARETLAAELRQSAQITYPG